jgi:hypothetical protein
MEGADGDIIHAEGVQFGFTLSAASAQGSGGRDLIPKSWVGLRGLDDPFDLVTQMAEVVWINAQAEYFIDRGKEVRKRADRTQRRRVGGTDQPPCRRQDQCIFDRCQRHTALM